MARDADDGIVAHGFTGISIGGILLTDVHPVTPRCLCQVGAVVEDEWPDCCSLLEGQIQWSSCLEQPCWSVAFGDYVLHVFRH